MRHVTITLVFLLLLKHSAFACSCLKPPSVQDNWAAANQVFIGVVERIDTTGHFYNSTGGTTTLFTIRILESFKGEVYKENVFRTFVSDGRGSCDTYFTPGEKYLIYAYGDYFPGFLKSSSCDRTGIYKGIGKSELKQLRNLSLESKTEASTYPMPHKMHEFEVSMMKEENDRLRVTNKLLRITTSSLVGLLVVLSLIFWIKFRKRSHNQA